MSNEARTCDDCGEPTTDFEILIDYVRCRECWDKYIQNGYISRLETNVSILEETREELKRERDEYLELLDEAFLQFSAFPEDLTSYTNGWLDDNASSTLRSIADALGKAGRLERHPENKRLYRRTK